MNIIICNKIFIYTSTINTLVKINEKREIKKREIKKREIKKRKRKEKKERKKKKKKKNNLNIFHVIFVNSMPYIIVIDKTGTVKEINIKEYNPVDLYKKANFKSAEGFQLEHKWIITSKQTIAIYGKKTGKAGQENKYDFPPPIDTILFFGGCVLVSESSESITDLRISEWNTIYEKLMGGFEDLKDTDDEEVEDEEEENENEYICDDFLVEDDEEVSIEEEEEEEEIEEIEEVIKKQSKKTKTKSKKEKKNNKQKNIPSELEEVLYLDCQSELEEEEYFA